MEIDKLLIEEPPLQVLPTLAVMIGLNEAILLQQIHYWVRENARDKRDKQATHYFEGEWWMYNSMPEWHRAMPFWSERTILRTLQCLEALGVVVTRLHENPRKGKWYRVNRPKLAEIAANSNPDDAKRGDDEGCQIVTPEIGVRLSPQGDSLSSQDGQLVTPTSTTENTTETINKDSEAVCVADAPSTAHRSVTPSFSDEGSKGQDSRKNQQQAKKNDGSMFRQTQPIHTDEKPPTPAGTWLLGILRTQPGYNGKSVDTNAANKLSKRIDTPDYGKLEATVEGLHKSNPQWVEWMDDRLRSYIKWRLETGKGMLGAYDAVCYIWTQHKRFLDEKKGVGTEAAQTSPLDKYAKYFGFEVIRETINGIDYRNGRAVPGQNVDDTNKTVWALDSVDETAVLKRFRG
jgi:hypothetical protein